MISDRLPWQGQLYDNELQISHTVDAKKGDKIVRTSYANFPLVEVTDQLYNPDNEWIVKGGHQHILVSGKLTAHFEWTDSENITQEHIDQYIDYLTNVEKANWEVSADLSKQYLTATASYVGSYNEWSTPPADYVFYTPKATIVLEEDGSELMCILRKTDRLAWTCRQIDINPGETKEIEKASDHCYTIFTKDVTANGASLAKWSVRKQESNSLSVENNNSEPCKIIQYYK